MPRMLEFARTVCTVVGALTLWALLTGVIASLVIRRLRRAERTSPARPGARAERLVGATSAPAAGTSAGATVLPLISRGTAPDRRAHPAPHPRPAAAAPGGAERRAQTWVDVPSWVARDRQWAVAVVLLGSPEIAARTHEFVDFSRRRIAWSRLLAEATAWPRRERLLVQLAHDLAGDAKQAHVPDDAASLRAPSSSPSVAVAELVTDLDEVALDRVHTAVDLRRGAVSFDEAVERAGLG